MDAIFTKLYYRSRTGGLEGGPVEYEIISILLDI